jgi:GNAT superfamily N-acetyltransferase
VPHIVNAAVRFAKDAYPNDPCDEGHIAGVVMHAIDDDDALVAVLETDVLEFAGCFLGCTGPNPLTGRLECAEILIWVEPKFRGRGRALLDYAEEWAKAKRCHSVALSRPEALDRVGRVFMAWGYSPSERWLRKVL